jgi:hypothetical protein
MQNGSSHSPPQTLPFSVPPYLLSIDDVAQQLGSDTDRGLPDAVVGNLQTQYGPNAVCPQELG